MNTSLNQEKKRVGSVFRTFYFLIFFGLGALLPLLGVYLKNYVHLSGMQVGNIMSIGSVVMIFAQPMWGMLCDYTQKPRHVLFFTLLFTGAIGLLYSTTTHYSILIVIAILLAFGQSAMTPISDSITLSYVQRKGGNYGSIRLYGALGFAFAVLVAGKASEYFGVHIIFYLFAAALFTAAFLTTLLPSEGTSMRVDIIKGCRHLFKQRDFVLFLCCTFFIFGPINANNTYFGLLITKLGGTLAGVGVAFLFAAGSEAPFMKVAAYFINKAGIKRIILFSALISAARWLFYSFEPPLPILYATTISQGLSIGLFIPAALQYVREITPSSMQSTAVSLYATAGGGFGTWFCTFIGGVLMDRFGIQSIYLCYATLTFIGIILFWVHTKGWLAQQPNLAGRESA
ncbi:MFS transporter [Microbacteriaceae bacterium 4G12]